MNFRTVKWAIRDLYVSTRPHPRPLAKPRVIQFPVNDICNSKCQMCHIWTQKLDYQIEPVALARILANPLFSEVRSVGVNGGEPTLRSDLPQLIDVLFAQLPSLSGISLITNALNSQQVIERIEDVGASVRSHGGNLDVMVSLDGVGQVHDLVRGRQHNFDHARRVIDHIRQSETVTSYRLGATLIGDNVYGMHDLLDFAIENDIYVKFRLGIPHQRLYTADLVEPYRLSQAQIEHICIFLENLLLHYERTPLQRAFYRSLIDQLAYGKPRAASCSWQHQGVTLTSRGELLYCAVASKTLGDAKITDPGALYFGHNAHRLEILGTRCDGCLHDYLGLPSTGILLKSYANKLLTKLHVPVDDLKQSTLLEPLRKYRKRSRFRQRIRVHQMSADALSALTPAPWRPPDGQRRPRILLCGWYGTETLGDKAILGGVISALHQALGPVDLHLASLDPFISASTQRQLPTLAAAQIHSLHEAAALVPSMDLLVFAGGPIMAIDPLVDMVDLFARAAKADVPSLIAGCGVGPQGTAEQNQYIAHLLRLASGRIYRDGASMEMAQQLMDPRRNPHAVPTSGKAAEVPSRDPRHRVRSVDPSHDWVAEDPAYHWLRTHLDDTAQNVQPSGAPTLVLGLRDWPFREYAPDLSQRDGTAIRRRFDDEVLVGLTMLTQEMPDLRIVPFPMCTNHLGSDDRWYYRRLLRRAPQLVPFIDDAYLNEEVLPEEAVVQFAAADAVLGMRFHSLVFARALNVPSVAIDYTLGRGKVSAFARQWGVDAIDLREFDRTRMVQALRLRLRREVDRPASFGLRFPAAMLDFFDTTSAHHAPVEDSNGGRAASHG